MTDEDARAVLARLDERSMAARSDLAEIKEKLDSKADVKDLEKYVSKEAFRSVRLIAYGVVSTAIVTLGWLVSELVTRKLWP